MHVAVPLTLPSTLLPLQLVPIPPTRPQHPNCHLLSPAGTPSLLSLPLLEQVLQALDRRFGLAAGAEVGARVCCLGVLAACLSRRGSSSVCCRQSCAMPCHVGSHCAPRMKRPWNVMPHAAASSSMHAMPRAEVQHTACTTPGHAMPRLTRGTPCWVRSGHADLH